MPATSLAWKFMLVGRTTCGESSPAKPALMEPVPLSMTTASLLWKALIAGAASVLPSYHEFYLAYLQVVQDPAIVAALEAKLRLI